MMRRPLALLLSLTLAFPVNAYDLPDLGDVAASELSPATERRIGEQIISQIRWRDAAYLDDPEIEDYINRIGHKLAAVSSNPGLDFDFFVVNDPTLNALRCPVASSACIPACCWRRRPSPSLLRCWATRSRTSPSATSRRSSASRASRRC